MGLLLLLAEALGVGARAFAGGMEVLRDNVGWVVGIVIIDIVVGAAIWLWCVH